jgi:hypothetical protein
LILIAEDTAKWAKAVKFAGHHSGVTQRLYQFRARRVALRASATVSLATWLIAK